MEIVEFLTEAKHRTTIHLKPFNKAEHKKKLNVWVSCEIMQPTRSFSKRMETGDNVKRKWSWLNRVEPAQAVA